MERGRRIIFLLATMMVVTLFCLPSFSAENNQKNEQQEQNDIWNEEDRGPGRRGPGPRRFDLTESEIDQVMKELKKTNPEIAEKLDKLRKEKDKSREFQDELRKYGGEALGKIMRERINKWRDRRREEFLEWLQKNYPKVSSELSKLKGKPDLYWKKFELIRKDYWRIFEEEQRNPELAEVLKEDLRLRKRRDDLLRRIKCSENDKDKKKLSEQLKDVVGKRYDLIVRRKEIAYDRLLNWIENLKKELKKSREDIEQSRKKQVKDENVQKRIRDLIAGGPPFKWN